jgi:mRNA interferase RelE/StbE
MTPVVLSAKSMKFLDSLDAKQYRQIGKRIWSLQDDSSPHDIKHLSGYPGYFRIDNGEYRVIFCRRDGLIEITLIGKRNGDEVYKDFARL